MRAMGFVHMICIVFLIADQSAPNASANGVFSIEQAECLADRVVIVETSSEGGGDVLARCYASSFKVFSNRDSPGPRVISQSSGANDCVIKTVSRR